MTSPESDKQKVIRPKRTNGKIKISPEKKRNNTSAHKWMLKVRERLMMGCGWTASKEEKTNPAKNWSLKQEVGKKGDLKRGKTQINGSEFGLHMMKKRQMWMREAQRRRQFFKFEAELKYPLFVFLILAFYSSHPLIFELNPTHAYGGKEREVCKNLICHS